MIKEAIILAGGKGTRLQSVVSEFPKSMAPINGIPFLAYQLDYLAQYKIETVYLAVGYLSHVIENYFGNYYNTINIEYIKELEPLGTGGAISQAISFTKTEDVVVLNGDSLFTIDLNSMYALHRSNKSDCSIALKKLENFERYGVVKTNIEDRIIGFEEKRKQAKGTINGGIYLLNKVRFSALSFPNHYSFEKDYLESQFMNFSFYGFQSSEYFLDIGIPEDYEKAQEDFKQYKNWEIDKTWTLFLDRDGVINKQIKGGYVTHIENFDFIDGAIDSIALLSRIFGRIVVVTNQQCVGKGILTKKELDSIHSFMIQRIEENGGKIDKVYFAPQLAEENSTLRKPNSGMADLALVDFPEIDFTKSVMVGDSISDIEFGQNKRMKTVLITKDLIGLPERCHTGLKDFLKSIS